MWKDVAIDWNNKRLQGSTTGNGAKLILALHGFNNNSSLFHFLSPLQEQYTIVAIDFPFHGNNKWKRGEVFTTEDLSGFIATLCTMFSVAQLSLCAFSMGGRIALKITELLPGSIDKLVLIAPDGLVFSPFYYFVTRMAAGRAMFKSALNKPQKLKAFLAFARDKKLLDSKFYDFLQRNIESEYYRTLIVDVWLSTSQLIPKQKTVKKMIQRYGIETHLFMGRNDKVIPLKNGIHFATGIDDIHLHILDKGHWMFDRESASEIVNSFL